MDLATSVQRSIPQSSQVRTGTVTAVSGTRVTVSVGGGSVYAASTSSYPPRVGDVVQLTCQNASWLIVGEVPTTSAPQLITGSIWANGSLPLQYVPTPWGPLLMGDLSPGAAAKANGTVIFTMPAGQYPTLHAVNIPVSVDVTVSAGQSPHFFITTAGQVQCWGCSSATGVAVAAIIPTVMI